jgi:hypothetical protein
MAALGLRKKRPRLGRANAAVNWGWMIQAVPVWDCEVETEIVETPLTIYATGRLENHIQHLTHESQHNAIHIKPINKETWPILNQFDTNKGTDRRDMLVKIAIMA